MSNSLDLDLLYTIETSEKMACDIYFDSTEYLNQKIYKGLIEEEVTEKDHVLIFSKRAECKLELCQYKFIKNKDGTYRIQNITPNGVGQLYAFKGGVLITYDVLKPLNTMFYFHIIPTDITNFYKIQTYDKKGTLEPYQLSSLPYDIMQVNKNVSTVGFFIIPQNDAQGNEYQYGDLTAKIPKAIIHTRVPDNYEMCAMEGDECEDIKPGSVVYFGSPITNRYYSKRIPTEKINCNSQIFEDPSIGSAKYCYKQRQN